MITILSLTSNTNYSHDPVAYYRNRDPHRKATPEQSLAASVLFSAVTDYSHQSRQLREDAIEWLYSDFDLDTPFSAKWCLAAVGLDPDITLPAILRALESSTIRKRTNYRSHPV